LVSILAVIALTWVIGWRIPLKPSTPQESSVVKQRELGGRSILLASASLPRSLRERRDMIKGCVLLLGQDYMKEC